MHTRLADERTKRNDGVVGKLVICPNSEYLQILKYRAEMTRCIYW